MGKAPVPPPKRHPNESHEDYMDRLREYRDKDLTPYCSFSGNAGSAILYALFGIGMTVFTIIFLLGT